MGTTESTLYEASLPPMDRSGHSQNRTSSSRPPLRRPRPPPPHVMTLKGMILGLPNSGKRTLLQRLEGKDPFVNTEEEPSSDTSITVAYHPPAQVKERIQLQVQLAPEFNEPDFCVVLINPRHDPKTLRQYLDKIVSMIVQRQHKLCLCLLLNFRDLNDTCDSDVIQYSNLQEWAKEIREHQTKLDQVVVQCGTTSLRNCYGLSSLHHFIYRSYLLRTQDDLEQRLAQVRAELVKSSEVPTMTYEAFLEVLEQTEGKKRNIIKNRNEKAKEPSAQVTGKESRRETRASQDGRRQRSVRRPEEDSSESEPSPPPRIDHEGQRLGLRRGPGRGMPRTHVDPKQSLDDFFADDDDEEDATPVTSNRWSNHVHHAAGSDDDDDFFYDEGGHRHQHGDIVSDSSSDEENQGSAAAATQERLLHAREQSIVDEESMDDSPKAKPKAVSQTNGTTAKKVYKSATNVDRAGYPKDVKEPDKVDIARDAPDHDDSAENGWGDDDDIDFDEEDTGSDHDESNVDKKVLPTGKEEHGDTNGMDNGLSHKNEDDVSESDDGDANGSSDHDLDVSDTGSPPTKQKSSTANDKATPPGPEPVAGDHEQNSGDHQRKATPTNKGSKDTEASPAEKDTARRTTEKKHGDRATESHKTASHKSALHPNESSDDDDDFMVEEAPSAASTVRQNDSLSEKKVATVVDKHEPPKVSPSGNSDAPTASSGISAAALAAIAEAERQAQLMMQENADEVPKPPKKSKKKKDPKEKKEKKRKKEKRKSNASST